MLAEYLGKELKRGLKRKRWSQARLAKEANISEKHLSFLLNNRAAGSVAMWNKLLMLVDVNLGEKK